MNGLAYRFLKNLSLLILSIFIFNCTFSFCANANLKFGASEKNSSDVLVEVSNIGVMSATFSWEYPDEEEFMMGDYINLIVFEGKYRGQTPVYSIAHNVDGINLGDSTKFECKSLAPSTEYIVKFEFVKADGSSYESEKSFTTQDIDFKNIYFQEVEDDVSHSKKVNLFWELTNSDFEFVDGYSIQIFMKKFGDNDFFKDPFFETKEKVNNAEIEVPNFEEMYDFKIIYNLGEKFFESEIFSLDILAKGIDFKIGELSTSSAKLSWDFIDESILKDESEIQIFIKQDDDVDYEIEPFLKIKGRDELLKNKNYEINGLKFDTKYNLKIKFIIENIEEFKKSTPIYKEDKFEFKTNSLDIKDLKVVSTQDKKIVIGWEYSGDNVSFSDNDVLTVYLKECTDKEYKEVSKIDGNKLIETKNVEISLDKYNVDYDIKIEMYSGKSIFKYLTHRVEVPEFVFNVKETKVNSLKFLMLMDSKFKIDDADKIEIFAKEVDEIKNDGKLVEKKEDEYISIFNKTLKEIYNDEQNNTKVENEGSESNLNSKEILIDKFKEKFPEVENEDRKYDFKILIFKGENLFQKKEFILKLNNNDFQIINISFKNKTEKKVEATIEYAPCDFDFDGIKSLTCTIETGNKKRSNTKKIDINGDFKNKTKIDIEFDKAENYKLKFVYNFKENVKAEEKNYKNLSPLTESSQDEIDNGILVESKTKEPVEFETNYTHKFDFFSFKCVDDSLSELKFKFLFDNYYEIKDGDVVEIFSKSGVDEFGNAVVTFKQGEDGFYFKNIDVFDMFGFNFNTDYKFKAKFISKSGIIIEKEVDVKTIDVKFEKINFEHLSDVTAVLKWRLDKNFKFTSNDVLKIFYKEETKNDYPTEPNDVIEEINLVNGEFVYVDLIDTKYDVKFVFESGDKKFEKEFKLDTQIGDINFEVLNVYETSAYVKWDYPEDYEMFDGETLSLFLKTSNQSSYDEEPDYFMEQNSDKDEYLEDFKSAKFYDLLPNTDYEAKIIQDFGESGKREKEIKFKTNEISVEEIKVKTIKPFEFEIGWKLSSNTIEFNEDNDYVNIYIKNSEEEWSSDTLIYTSSNRILNFNDARFVVDDRKLTYDVKVEYGIANNNFSKVISTKLFYIDYEELSYDDEEFGEINIILNYSDSVKFKDGDSIDVFVSKPKSLDYEQKFSSKHSQSNDLNSLNRIKLKGIKQTSSIVVCPKSSDVKIFPTGIIYDTRAENSSTLEILSELKGDEIFVGMPMDYELDKSVKVFNSIGGESFYDVLDDGTEVIVISKIVPGKKYENTMLVATDVDGEEVELYIGEFTIEPSTLLEEFLRNSYFFAFDREPDEGGYNYWKNELTENENITGKYFLINLMFAEKEFADRNLSDQDLVKALYQIVVNREYDSKGLSYWVAIYGQYLEKFNGDKYEAKKTMVLRMVYEPEFQRLCKEMNIKW